MTDGELMQWVRDNDKDYRGLSDLEIYEKGYGDAKNAAVHFAKALKNGGKNPHMRAFCLSRIYMLQQIMLEESALPAT